MFRHPAVATCSMCSGRVPMGTPGTLERTGRADGWKTAECSESAGTLGRGWTGEPSRRGGRAMKPRAAPVNGSIGNPPPNPPETHSGGNGGTFPRVEWRRGGWMPLADGRALWRSPVSGFPRLVRLTAGWRQRGGCYFVGLEVTCLPNEVEAMVAWLTGAAPRPEGIIEAPGGRYFVSTGARNP